MKTESALLRFEHDIYSIEADICKDICKYAEQASDEDELLREHCMDCPIGRLEGKMTDKEYLEDLKEELLKVVKEAASGNTDFLKVLPETARVLKELIS